MSCYTLQEFINAGGWSANQFLRHAVDVMIELSKVKGVDIEIRRTVINIAYKDRVVKAYVHHGKGVPRSVATLMVKKPGHKQAQWVANFEASNTSSQELLNVIRKELEIA